MLVKTLQATPETDKKLKDKYFNLGLQDRKNNIKRTNLTGMPKEWYEVGYNFISSE